MKKLTRADKRGPEKATYASKIKGTYFSGPWLFQSHADQPKLLKIKRTKVLTFLLRQKFWEKRVRFRSRFKSKHSIFQVRFSFFSSKAFFYPER